MDFPPSENICGTDLYPFCDEKCDNTYGWDKSKFSDTREIYSFYDLRLLGPQDIILMSQVSNVIKRLGYNDLYHLSRLAQNIMQRYCNKKQKLFKEMDPVWVIMNFNLPHVSIFESGVSVSFEVMPMGFKRGKFMVIYEHTFNDNGLKLVAQHNHY